MHWFDRLARGVADGPRTSTRRELFRGAAAVTAAASVGPALARAAEPTGRRAAAQPGCEECIRTALEANKAKIEACERRAAAKAKGKGRNSTPAVLARRTACVAKARSSLADMMRGCAAFSCESPGIEKELPPDVSGHAQCPEGTQACVKNMCCAFGDLCCPCASGYEGYICCAGVIGCTCCG